MSSEAEHVATGADVDATEADRINTGALGTLVAVGLFAMISITAAMTALVRHDLDIEQGQKANEENRVVTDLKAAQRGLLNGPAGYVDRSKGVVSLPIDVAKQAVIGDLARDPATATPPASASAAAPAAAASGGVQVTGGTVDSGAAPATMGATGAAAEANKSAAAATPDDAKNNAAPVKPERGREVTKPAPGGAGKTPPVPSPTPTAATPGAQSPGPTPTDSKK